MHKYQDSFFYSDDQQEKNNQSLEEIQSIIKQQYKNTKNIKNCSQIPRKRGRPRKNQSINNKNIKQQHQQRQNNIILINRQNYHKIYFQFCQKIQKLQFIPIDCFEDLFYSWAFLQIIEESKNRQSLQQKSMNNIQIRSFIIFQALQDFMKESLPDFPLKQSITISSMDKKIYQKMNIQVPPSILNTEYIKNLFKNKKFKQFYRIYLKDNRVSQYYLRKCHDQVLQFCQRISLIGECQKNNQKKVQQFKKINKPMSLIEVKFYEEQAKRLYSQYCR